ncbi:MAG TPA: glycosyltransferase [Pirellulales bacterium]|nr:glycosyltransferase [Pirellulales bacterium]
MPRLAIVIPAVGTAESLEATLLAVLENRPHDCEIIAAANFDYADPYELADEIRFVSVPSGVDLVACASAAIAVARSAVVHILAAGCTVSERWADRALEHFADLSVGAVAPLIVHRDEHERVLAAGVDYRAGGGRRVRTKKLAKLTAAGPTAVFGVCAPAAFLRRSALEAVGGFSGDVGPQLADVELAWAMRRAGYRTLLEPHAIVQAQALPTAAISRFRQGLYAERLFWRHAAEIGWFQALAAHAGLVAWDMAAHFWQPSACARLAGRFSAIADLRHHLVRRPAVPSDAEAEPMPSRHLRIDGDHAPRPGTRDKQSSRRMRSA